MDERPTVPNCAWGGLEYNLFGTDEFIAFCRAVGCEPMICVNAGDGGEQEAADWVQYCNGDASTPMGRLRAMNGHKEPYNIRYWEIGNELWYRHQIGWTTPAGNVDRYLRFRAAMLAVDPTIRLQGCGDQLAGPESEWNRQLIEETGGTMQTITDHILSGGQVIPRTDPVEMFHAFMSQAQILGDMYRGIRDKMLAAGIDRPRLALTELQLFAHFSGRFEGPHWGLEKLRADTMPTPATIAEALYDATIIHECIRMGDFVEMITHSATVNHGGGLRKTRERVWANPCHYGHAMGLDLAGGTPVKLEVRCGTFSRRTSLDYSIIPVLGDVPVLDAMAVLKDEGRTLVIMLVHRCATCGPISVTIDVGDFEAAPEAEVITLSGKSISDANTAEEPRRIVPVSVSLSVADHKAELTLPPYSLARLTVKSG